MTSKVLVDGDRSHCGWIEIALCYLPEDVLTRYGSNLAVIGIGSIGACRVPHHYRERELVLLSDWVFPPAGDSEGDDTGRFFIVTVLHEIAHAICNHRSPLLDKLTAEEAQSQEDEADHLALDWFNQRVNRQEDEYLKPLVVNDFREFVGRYAKLFDDFEEVKAKWHREDGT